MVRPIPSGAPVPSLNDLTARLSLKRFPPPGAHERRNLIQREALLRRITAEFHDMPGLVLTLKQASRFLGVDEAACSRILTALTSAGVLHRSQSEYYSRREPGT